MPELPPEASLGSDLRGHFSLIAKCAGRGLLVWMGYVILGVLVSWMCFWFAAGDIWHAGLGPMGVHAGGGFGAVVFLVILLVMPPTWTSLAYVVGAPFVFAFVGHAMALKAALQRALQAKSDFIAGAVCTLSWPVAKRLAGVPGKTTVKERTRALLDRVESMQDAPRAVRWLLARTIRVLKVPEIFSTADILVRIETEPDAAEKTLRSAIEARLREATEGGLWTRAWLLVAVVVLITLARRFWIYW